MATAEFATIRETGVGKRWRTSRRTIDLSSPVLMGVLNVTPDSFSDGGLFFDRQAAGRRIEELAREGADIIDIGGESTRPGSLPVAEDEEVRRVLPAIEAAAQQAGVAVCVDTTKSGVARRALDAGAEIINDVSGLRFDPVLAGLAAETGAGLALMHMRGEPRTMQERIHYDDLIGEVGGELGKSVEAALRAGCRPDQLVVDPGIGFGKTARQNLALINMLDQLEPAGYPVLIGPSRKSFIGKTLGLEVDQRLEATLAACVIAFLRGARVFRVHDVRAARRALDMAKSIIEEKDRGQLS